MLQNLHVKNLALIDETEVDFGPGLNILTGETEPANLSLWALSDWLSVGDTVQICSETALPVVLWNLLFR